MERDQLADEEAVEGIAALPRWVEDPFLCADEADLDTARAEPFVERGLGDGVGDDEVGRAQCKAV